MDDQPMPGGETTYCLPDQPTNQPTTPTHRLDPGYISIRITVDHSRLNDVLELFFDQDYILYPHTGAHGDNQHYHILVGHLASSHGPWDDHDFKKVAERLRKRIKDKLGLIGNQSIRVKVMDNDITKAIQYCSKERTTPIHSESPVWEFLIESSPRWEEPGKEFGQKMLPKVAIKKDMDADWQLTYANIVPKAVNHARVHGLTGSLKNVVQHMCEHTKWRPSFHMIKNGVPDYYYKDFDFRSGKTKKFDMTWMDPKF